MPTPQFVRSSVRMHAPAATVWRMLTDPAVTAQYMYGCEIVSTWVLGGPFNWKGAADGVVYVKGTLVALEPNRLLRYTMIDPNSTLADVPANYLTQTCELTAAGDDTTLTFETGDFTAVGNGDERYQHTVAGGDELLVRMKAIAEALPR